MKISLIGFTRNGTNLGRLLSIFLKEQGYDARIFTTGDDVREMEIVSIGEPLKDWTKRQFKEVSGIVFVGATGIAVRTIAPFLNDKTTDPAVLVHR
jgi:cobalt-precorrin 5A hydrolase